MVKPFSGIEGPHPPLTESLRALEGQIAPLVQDAELVQWRPQPKGWVAATRHLAVPALGGPDEYRVSQYLGPQPSEGQYDFGISAPFDFVRWPVGTSDPAEVSFEGFADAKVDIEDFLAGLVRKLHSAEPFNPKTHAIVSTRRSLGLSMIFERQLVTVGQREAIERKAKQNHRQ